METKHRKKTISIAGMLLTFLINTFITAKLNVLNNMWRMPGVKGSERDFNAGAKMINLRGFKNKF